MSKKRHGKLDADEPAEAPPPNKTKPVARAGGLPWHPAMRWFASVLIVLHVAAVFSAPWNLSTDPALPPGYVMPRDRQGRPQPPPLDSPVWQQPRIARALGWFFGHYTDLTYLNHGYQFFAPDPAGSHIIRYRVLDAAGQEVAKGKFPDHDEHWPRLLYHRHLMLADQTGDLGEASGRHYAQHMMRVHDGRRVRLEWILHTLLPPERVLEETPLDADSTYITLATIDETRREEPTTPAGEMPVAIPGGAR